MVKLKSLFRWLLWLSYRQCVEALFRSSELDKGDIYEMQHYGYFPVEKYYSIGITTTTLSPWVDRHYQIPDTKTLSPDFRVPELLPTPKPLGRFVTAYKQFNRPYRFSSSAYIAYHYGHARLPKFFKPYPGLDKVNMSHPIPMYDLSVWALTVPTYSYRPYDKKGYRAVFCKRPSSHEFYQTSPGLRSDEDYWVFGYQFIRAYNRKPTPSIKYGVRTRNIVYPCAKKEWGWFLCMGGRWAPLGLDSGALLHRTTHVRQRGWLEAPDMTGWKFWDRTSTVKPIVRMDGLVGLGAFSLNLRSNKLVHYFTVTETHHVLDFLYSSYMGRLPYAYLDNRFYDTQWGAPYPKPWALEIFKFGPTDYQTGIYSNKLPYPGDNTLL